MVQFHNQAGKYSLKVKIVNCDFIVKGSIPFICPFSVCLMDRISGYELENKGSNPFRKVYICKKGEWMVKLSNCKFDSYWIVGSSPTSFKTKSVLFKIGVILENI